jgi:chorismate mutase
MTPPTPEPKEESMTNRMMKLQERIKRMDEKIGELMSQRVGLEEKLATAIRAAKEAK